MMTMKQVFVALGLFFPGLCGIEGQVLIGPGNEKLHAGASLELKAAGGTGGVMMPQVSLTSAMVWAPIEGSPVEGMMVYNTNETRQSDLEGKGIYTWVEGRWELVSHAVPCASPPADPVIASSGYVDPLEPFTPFLVYVDNAAEGVSYEWDVSPGMTGQSLSDVITVIGTGKADYTVSVRARNACGVSNKVSETFRIAPFSLPPKEISGNGIIQGIACYNVSQGNYSTFPDYDPNKRIRKYMLSLQYNNGVTNLKYGKTNDADGIIKSVSRGTSDDVTSGQYPITVVFADDVNDIIKRTKRSTAEIYVSYFYMDDKYNSLTITLQENSCCPYGLGKIVNNGAYMGVDIFDLYNVSFKISHFKPIPNASLCVWPLDQGSQIVPGGSESNFWLNAHSKCNMSMSQYGGGWRLPNLGEMYYKLHSFFLNNGGQNTSSDGTFSRYFSSTVKNNELNNVIHTQVNMQNPAKSVTISDIPINKQISAKANYRCVKTISQ
ncbi:MAG: hypothetical protein LBH58_00535 [Tannerellaceae bacterium]|jgi:hypothetical protein|nr:hypothetical protein [Tannerellaceae bacterium]